MRDKINMEKVYGIVDKDVIIQIKKELSQISQKIKDLISKKDVT
jgi:hypothetical protein